MITNKRYNYEHFKSDRHQGYEALRELTRCLHQLCSKNHKEVKNIGKIEDTPLNKLKRGNLSLYELFKSCSIIPGPDTKVVILRFGNNKYRMVFKWDAIHRNVIHILAFDFDHSLYDHGC